jgi:hypothetical protein
VVHYKQNFLLDELSASYENRRKVFKRLIKSYCLLSLMLLKKQERMVLVTIIDRFYFETSRAMDEKEKRMAMTSAFQDVVEQYEKINKDPYTVMRNHL